jgi:hypothetical protein
MHFMMMKSRYDVAKDLYKNKSLHRSTDAGFFVSGSY